MPEAALGLLHTVPNPFVQVRVDSAWDTLGLDVPAINDAAFQTCIQTIRDVRTTHQSHGLLLAGLAGTGKTHLLARLRRWLYEQQSGSFVYVLPVTAPDRFHRHVLHAVAGDMLRRPPEGRPLGQMEIAIAHHLMADPHASLDAMASWWDEILSQHPAGLLLFDFLRGSLASVADDLELDPAVLSVVLQHVARLHRSEARAWLLGRPLTEDECAALSVAGTLDDEMRAADALATLVRFAGGRSTLVLAFDQVEGLQTDRTDVVPLLSWGHGIADLLAQTRNVAVVTCAQISFLDDLRQAVGLALFDGRIAERRARLDVLSAAQAVELVARRLQRSEELQQVRLVQRHRIAGEALDDPSWPLGRGPIETLAVKPDLTARKLLVDCRELFDVRRTEMTGAPPSQASTSETLVDVWERTLAEEAARPIDRIDEGVYVDGLLRAADAIPALGLRASRSKERDVDLRVESGSQSMDVAVCHAENMKSLAARLHRLVEMSRRSPGTRLVVVRDQRLGISPRAKKTREYLDELAALGTRVLRPPKEAYDALAAIRRLLAESAAGDLTLDGREVPPDQLKRWLADDIPAAVRDLAAELGGLDAPADPAVDTALEHLHDLLRKEFVVELTSAASGLEQTPDWTRALIERHADTVGRIEGTPELLFLQPEAMARD
jgi:hypothetical protein